MELTINLTNLKIGKLLKEVIVELIDLHKFRIILKEGKKRQIRRMCGKVGLTVYDLFRVRIGNISIDRINSSNWRFVSNDIFSFDTSK